MQQIKDKILKAVASAQTTPTGRVSLYTADNTSPDGYANEMLFFIKPELTRSCAMPINLGAILDLIFPQLEKYGMKILDVTLLGAQYMRESGAIASHYGVINRIANNAVAAMSATAKDTFKAKFGQSVEEAKPLGAFELIKLYPFLNAESLDMVWQNAQGFTKLAGGTYCKTVEFDAQTFRLVNGFHPRQLAHFEEEGRSIVTFRLVTNTDWATARNDLIGATNPEKANAGSLRRTFLEKKEELGLEEVSQGINGVHLSAGPIEGLAELCRFSGVNLQSDIMGMQGFLLGKHLLASADETTIRTILSDSSLTVNGKSLSVFEATEEQNTADALETLRQAGMAINTQQAA